MASHSEAQQIAGGRGKSARQILLLTVLFCVVYYAVVRLGGWQASLAESNLQANMIRISRYLGDPQPKLVLVGSSVAGRLLPSYFAKHGLIVENLGLDGSRPLFAFEIVRLGAHPPKKMLVDTSTLFQPLMENDNTMRQAIINPSFAMSREWPLLRPEYRPSSIAYTFLKNKKESRGGQVLPPFPTGTPGPRIPNPWKEEDQYAAVRDALRTFQAQGVAIEFLVVPRGEGWGQPARGLVRKMADELGVPVIEPGPDLAKQGVVLSFSDGMHLDGPSAERVAAWLSEKEKGQ